MLRPWSDRSSEWFEECSGAFGGGKGGGEVENGYFLKSCSGQKVLVCFSVLPLLSSPHPLLSLLSLSSLPPPSLFSFFLLHFPVKFFMEEGYTVGDGVCVVWNPALCWT